MQNSAVLFQKGLIMPSPCQNSPVFLHNLLDMRFYADENGIPCAGMDVSEKVCQPFGFLSGGAILALAETLAGYASLALCPENSCPVGIQISANHLKSVKKGGSVTAQARLLNKNDLLHVWEIRILDNSSELISLCQITNYIKKGKNHAKTMDNH